MNNKSIQKRLTACLAGVTILFGSLPICANAETDTQTVETMIAKHRAEYDELTVLLERCKDRGMQLDYDEINYNVLGKFPDYMEENLSRGDTELAAEQDKELTELYEKTKANLTSYISGTKEPLSAPTYVTSDISVKDKHFEATVDNGGVLEQQPVFFVGTGHDWNARQDIPLLSKLGFNAIQPELSGRFFMEKETFPVHKWSEKNNGYECDYELVTNEKYEGDKSLNLQSTAAQQDNKYWYMKQTVNVKPNTTYQYGLWAKAPDGAAGTWFHVHPNWDWNTRTWISGPVPDWKEFSAEYTTGVDETELTFTFCIEKPTKVWIDNVYLKERDSEVNILQNGGFENDIEADYWKINDYEINALAHDFDIMAENNLSGIFNTGAHLIPDVYREEYPEINSAQDWIFSTKTLLDHPKVKKYYEDYYNAIMPALAVKPAFDGIILMNEPVYTTYQETYYLPVFQEAMKEKYNDNIASLNSKWGTSYTSFNEVTMPTQIETTAQFYDWREFNDEVLVRYHQDVAGLVKKYDGNVLVQTKMQQSMMHTHTFKRHDSANNWEALAPTLDINSCDAFTSFAKRHEVTNNDIRTQNIFYDYQTSVKNAPIYNSEEHLYMDSETIGFSELECAYNTAALWQGAIHGKGGTIIWNWAKQETDGNGNKKSNIAALTERPGTVAAIGKTTLDLNRLSKEIVSISEAKANVGILYASENIPYTGQTDYMHSIYTAYSKLGENGQKTQFIATETEESLNKLSEMKCLIIPHVVAVNDAGFNAIKNFADNGGKLIVWGDDSLSKNEYGQNRNAAEVASIMEKAVKVDVTYRPNGWRIDAEGANRIGEAVRNAVEPYSRVSVIDKTTGKPLEECEYLYSDYDGKTIINLCSYRDDDREFEIYADGNKVNTFTDLISAEVYNEGALAKAYVPMLISVGESNTVEEDRSDNVIKELLNTAPVAGITYSDDEAYEGKSSVYVNCLWGKNISERASLFGIEDNKDYIVSFYMKGIAKGVQVNIGESSVRLDTRKDGWIHSKSGDDVSVTVTDTEKADWKKVQITGNSGTDAGNRALLVAIDEFREEQDGIGQRFYLDNLSIKNSDNGELVRNGGFEVRRIPVRTDKIISELHNESEVDGVEYSAAESYDGDWSLHINHSNLDWYPITASCADFGMKNGRKYDISFYFKGDIRTLYITEQGLCIADNKPWISGTNYPDVGQKVNGAYANGWYKFEVKDYILSSENQALLFMQDYNGVNNFYLDNLSIIESGRELVQNGSFEPSVYPPQKEMPIRKNAPVIKELLNKEEISGVSYSAEEAYDGDWAVHVNKNADVSAAPSAFGITEGKTYNVSFYIKGNIGNLFVSLSGKNRVLVTNDDIRSGTLTDIKKVSVENGWTKVEINNAVVEKADWETAFLVAEYNPDFYIDKLSITESNTELVENGNFEPAAIEFGELYAKINSDETVTVSMDVLKHRDEEDYTAPMLIFASYDNGCLTSCTTVNESIDVEKNNKWTEISKTVPIKADENMNVYLWESLESLKPLASAVEIK